MKSFTTSARKMSTTIPVGNSAPSSGNGFPSSRVPVTLRDSFFNDSFFQSAWEDFEKIREEMLRESKHFWTNVQMDDMKPLTMSNDPALSSSSANQMSSQSSNQMSSSSSMIQKNSSSNINSSTVDNKQLMPMNDDMFMPWFFPRRWMVPSTLSCSMEDGLFKDARNNTIFKDLDLFQHKDSQVIRMKDDDSKFEISFDTHDYRPDEIKVNVDANVLSISAKHEEKSDNRFVSRQFSRKYTLPEGCQAERVSSNLSSDGILMVTAPKRKEIRFQENTPIPVEVKK